MANLRHPDGRPMHHYDIRTALGLNPKLHLPKDGARAMYIDNVAVYVMSKNLARIRGVTKRTRAICPRCKGNFAAGNLVQHLKFCK